MQGEGDRMFHNEFSSSEDEEDIGTNSPRFSREDFKLDWLALPCAKGENISLALGALPALIKRSGIQDVFLLLTAKELLKYRVPSLISEYKNAGIEVHHWPIGDGTVPAIEELMHLLQELKMVLECGTKTLIHCYGGLGRACLVAACLMLDMNAGVTPEEVITTMRNLRGPGAIQTVKQYNFIFEYRQFRDGYLKKTFSTCTLPCF